MTDEPEYDENDLEWAFNVMMLHATVVRRPGNIPEWRAAMRKLARERGVKIQTGTTGRQGTAWAAAPNVSDQISKEINAMTGEASETVGFTDEATAKRNELYGPGGWNWDQRAKPPAAGLGKTDHPD